MPCYKDEKTGTWYCQFRYADFTGKRKQKRKRGFKTKREAQEWEREFHLQKAKSCDMTLARSCTSMTGSTMSATPQWTPSEMFLTPKSFRFSETGK